VPYIGKQLVRGQNRELDDISGSFNGSTTVFNLTVAGDSITPGSALQLFISVGGVLQNPNTDFTVAGNQITFSTAPGSGLSFFGILQGDAVDFNTPADGSVTTAKLGSNLTINVADGTVGTPSIQFNGSGTDTGFYSPGADQVAATVAGGEALRIDSSGRLLVGTSSSSQAARLVLQGNSASSTDSTVAIFAAGTATPSDGQVLGYLRFSDSGHVSAAEINGIRDGGTWTSGSSQPTRLVFSTTADGASSPTERMRITQLGRVIIGTGGSDPGYQCTIESVNSYALYVKQSTGDQTYPATTFHNVFTTGDNQLTHYYTDASSLRGSVTYNRGGGVIAYNTTSDYRAKTLLGSIDNPGETIDAFKVYRGVMNGATVERPMLVAHEAQEVAPYCVTGEKDAVNDEGNPVYQQMDHQVLVPLLIAEIQQLRARVAALEAQ